jgi:zinc transport system ATP-binding protein
MPVNTLSIKNLSVKYNNSNNILSDISFDINSGDYIGLVGPNGSGKTTLIKTILGLIKPSNGTISLFGNNPERFNDWHKIGYLPQKISSFNPLFPATVREVVSLGLISKKQSKEYSSKDNEQSINKALELFDIKNLNNNLIGELSGGQQQRVFLARAMATEPELLILDEPSTGLDPETRENFFDILHKINKGLKITIILITHDFGTIGKYSSKLLYLDKKIIFYGGFEDFCSSKDMTEYFGRFSQHIICHRHDEGQTI